MSRTGRMGRRIAEHYDEQGLPYNEVKVSKLAGGGYALKVDGMFICTFSDE